MHYAYPSKFPIDIIHAIKKHDKVCNYLDMPLQHAADAMLAGMKRQITKAEMLQLVKDIREIMPDICLRTTLIAGFPGETKKDIKELIEFLAEVRFDRVGVFTYSHEENTSAHDLKDNVPAKEKERRAQEIMDFQQDISYEKNLEKVGMTIKVIIDKKEAGRYLGRTQWDSVEVDNEVIVKSKTKLLPGQFVNVKITKAYDYDLEGVVVV
jgi:ribosomal protein S12 methylthiotransferase